IRSVLLLSLPRPPPTSTLFPYTTLFRSTRGPWAVRNPAVRFWTSSSGRRSRRWGVAAAAAVAVPAPGRGGTCWARLTDRHLPPRSEEHTSELQSRENLVCRLLLEKKKKT